MIPRNLKLGVFVLVGLNAFATTFYFNYLFFFMHSRFGFGNASNLGLSALNGLVYMFLAWFGGRVGQRSGYYFALRLGLIIMGLALGAGCLLAPLAGQLLVLVTWTMGMCFTWPNMEALISENETAKELSRLVGLYNVVWATGSALAYFAGGVLLNQLGMQSLFWLPAGIHLFQLVLIEFLARRPGAISIAVPVPVPFPDPVALSPAHVRATTTKTFLRMAWVANPFAYVAISTVIAVIPSLALRLDLSLAWAGIFCSIWFFARLAAFVWLWWWPGWHYRLDWLLGGYLLLMGSFLVLLLAPYLWGVLLAQIVFGLAVGLLYYSSLFYSMDAGETKGDHGGMHESALGAGVFAGPAVGAASLWLFPAHSGSSAWAVGGLLVIGGVMILAISASSARKGGNLCKFGISDPAEPG